MCFRSFQNKNGLHQKCSRPGGSQLPMVHQGNSKAFVNEFSGNPVVANSWKNIRQSNLNQDVYLCYGRRPIARNTALSASSSLPGYSHSFPASIPHLIEVWSGYSPAD